MENLKGFFRKCARIPQAVWAISIHRTSSKLARKGLYPFLNSQFSRIEPHANVLNVGAGGNIQRTLMRHSARNGFEVTSVDIDPARRPDIVADITSFDADGKKYDVIVMAEVLEHIPEAHLVPDKLRDLLSEGGIIILTVPFIFPLHDLPGDYYRFTRYGLEYLFRNFDSIEIEDRNSWSEAIIVLLARMTRESHYTTRIFMPLALFIAVALQPLAWLIGRLVRTEFITSGYVAVIKK